jgi:hypothetical protein
MQDDYTYTHYCDSYMQVKWLHIHSLIYISSYFS